MVQAEFRPVAVWTDAECYSNPPGKYAAEKMIDNDLGTYACLLDDIRTGKDTTVCPPRAAPPVTATFVLDLGAERTVSGMRFVARNGWVYVLAKNVSIFACATADFPRAIFVLLPVVRKLLPSAVGLDECGGSRK